METAIHSSQLDPQVVAAKAYQIWESMGRPEGAAEQTWMEAERQLRLAAEKAPTPSVRPEEKSAATAPAAPPAATAAATSAAPPPPVSDASEDPPSSPNAASGPKKATNGHRKNVRR